MFYTFIKKHYKNIKLQMFPIATFYLGIFVILCNRDYGIHTQLWTKQSNVRTNTKYTNHVNSFWHICDNLF